MATKSKVKAAAVSVQVPQTRGDCAAMIRALGDAQRVLAGRVSAMNDAIDWLIAGAILALVAFCGIAYDVWRRYHAQGGEGGHV